jgi:hypothetical protein
MDVNKAEQRQEIRTQMEKEVWEIGRKHPDTSEQVIRILQLISKYSDAVEDEIKETLCTDPAKINVLIFREFLESLRLALNIPNQKPFAEKLGIHQQTLSRLLKGEPARLKAGYATICEKIGVTIEEILSEYPDPLKRQPLLERAIQILKAK